MSEPRNIFDFANGCELVSTDEQTEYAINKMPDVFAELVTPKPGETVEVFRNRDNGNEQIVITDENGQKRGYARFTLSGTLKKGES